MDTGRAEGEGNTAWSLNEILGALRALEYMYSSRADDVGHYTGFLGPIWRSNIICHTVELAKFIQGMAVSKGLRASISEKSAFGERLVVLSLELTPEELLRWEKKGLKDGVAF